MDSYHVRINGQCLGPYTLDRIRQMTRKGQVGKKHDVSTDGVSWAPATTFPEIFERPSASFGVAVQPAAQDPGPTQAVTQSPSVPGSPPAEPRWYCNRNGSTEGPMPKAQLIAMIKRGEIAAHDLVFREGAADWVLAEDAPELAAAIPGGGGLSQPGVNAFCRECGAGVSQKAVMCPKCGAPTGGVMPGGLMPPTFDFPSPAGPALRPPGERKSKTVAAVLALLIGGFGIHHFYLGNPALGIVYILFCWTFIPALISFVEAIVFLTMSDAAFDEKYNT